MMPQGVSPSRVHICTVKAPTSGPLFFLLVAYRAVRKFWLFHAAGVLHNGTLHLSSFADSYFKICVSSKTKSIDDGIRKYK